MAERKSAVWVDSKVVQGPESFVMVRKLGYDQKRRATRLIADVYGGHLPKSMNETPDGAVDVAFLDVNDAFTRELLEANVLEWNWVDDDGQPLPLPKDDPAVIGKLTDEEVQFLARAINGQAAGAASGEPGKN